MAPPDAVGGSVRRNVLGGVTPPLASRASPVPQFGSAEETEPPRRPPLYVGETAATSRRLQLEGTLRRCLSLAPACTSIRGRPDTREPQDRRGGERGWPSPRTVGDRRQ